MASFIWNWWGQWYWMFQLSNRIKLNQILIRQLSRIKKFKQESLYFSYIVHRTCTVHNYIIFWSLVSYNRLFNIEIFSLFSCARLIIEKSSHTSAVEMYMYVKLYRLFEITVHYWQLALHFGCWNFFHFYGTCML